MTLQERIALRDAQIAADIKLLAERIGDLTSLSTTQKTSITAALNEIHDAIGNAGASIDDSAGDGNTNVTWSADKIFEAIEAAKAAVKSDILDGSPTALDTLKELSEALNNDPNFAATLANSMNNKVDFATAQTLTQEQKKQVCQNIGIGDPEIDLLANYETARGPL